MGFTILWIILFIVVAAENSKCTVCDKDGTECSSSVWRSSASEDAALRLTLTVGDSGDYGARPDPLEVVISLYIVLSCVGRGHCLSGTHIQVNFLDQRVRPSLSERFMRVLSGALHSAVSWCFVQAGTATTAMSVCADIRGCNWTAIQVCSLGTLVFFALSMVAGCLCCSASCRSASGGQVRTLMSHASHKERGYRDTRHHIRAQL